MRTRTASLATKDSGDDQHEEARDGTHLLEEQASRVDALAEGIERAGSDAPTDEGDHDDSERERQSVPDDELQQVGR